MTTSFSTATPSLTRTEVKFDNAKLALEAANRMRPQMLSFVRSITRDRKMKLEFCGDGSKTDGETVWLTPPLSLGRHRTHRRTECSEYDEQGVSLCQACREEDSFLTVALHECAHIVYKSTIEVDSVDFQRAKDYLYDRFEEKFPTLEHRHIETKVDLFLDARHITPENGYMAMASVESPWLPNLLNAVEDARVNLMTHGYRPGTTRMFRARSHQVLTEGFVQRDGTKKWWSDATIEQQLSVYAVFALSGFSDAEMGEYFDDEVIEVWNDSKIKTISESLDDLEAISDTLNMARNLLVRFNELGYMRLDDPEEEEEDSAPEDRKGGGGEDNRVGEGDSEPEDGDEEGSEEGPSSGDGSMDSESPESSDGADDSEPTKAEGSDDDGDDEQEGSEGEGKGEESEAEGEGEGDGSADTESGREQAEKNAAAAMSMQMAASDHANEAEEEVGARLDEEMPNVEMPKVDPEKDWSKVDSDMATAVGQGHHFDESSGKVHGVTELRFNDLEEWDGFRSMARMRARFENTSRIEPPSIYQRELAEKTAARVLPRIRKAFTANRAVKLTRGQKVGRIDASSIGRKLKTGRDDIFRKRELPTNRSYKVVIGLDISGSNTSGARGEYTTTMEVAKAAAFAQAEVLAKAGISFEFNCHTGDYDGRVGYDGIQLVIVKVKDWDEKWTPAVKARAEAIHYAGANLDGHSFEYYRKSLEKRPEDVGLILYYTDGCMPAENGTEELAIMRREMTLVKRRPDLEMLTIGVGNTEPRDKYGLEMVEYNTLADLDKVVKALEQKLVRR